MKKILTGTTLTLFLALFSVQADDALTTQNTTQPHYYPTHTWDHKLGLGATFGEPTGLSVKYFLNDKMAVDGSLGVGFYEETGFSTHAGLLWHLFDCCPGTSERMPFYIGAGPRIKVEDNDTWFGLRFPIGVSYMLEDAPMDVFFEVGPILDFTPEVRGSFTATLGIRYWF